uniref:Ricin B-type lectin domain-containing protein n=1 Tax=Panagrellus redivivus TaxID=6233 RepID=A0A7E4V616_PANRE
MLEGLVTWVLNNYVGEYLENLNADQLSIALLSGQVELENVPLKKTALSKFDVPLAVRSGIIGKLTLSIPITHMRSEPWILKMSDFLVLLGPAEGGYDASDIEGYEQTKKEQLLEALETAHKNQLLLNLGIPLKDDGTQNQYWGASLVSAVSNNIQLILSNVHIRYEDSRTMPDGVPFNFGVRIQHISIQTTNSQWKQEFVQPTDGVNTFKKLDIKGLSVFWNCHQEVHTDISSYAELKQMLSPESSKDTQFILQPFSMQARMEKNSSKFPLKGTPAIPRFKFDLRPEKINIELSKKQLAQIRLLTREWARFDRARQHRKWRPLVAIKGNAKKWWKFAIDRVLDDTSRSRQRCTLTFLLTRAKHLNAYCRSYRQKLEAYIADASAAALSGPRKGSVATGVVPVSAAGVEDTVFMKQIEHDSQFSYHELQLFRETVFRRIIREKEAERKAAAKAAGIEDDSSDVFEVLEARKKDSIVNTDEVDVRPVATSANNADGGGGLYGWFSGWFGATAPG